MLVSTISHVTVTETDHSEINRIYNTGKSTRLSITRLEQGSKSRELGSKPENKVTITEDMVTSPMNKVTIPDNKEQVQ